MEIGANSSALFGSSSPFGDTTGTDILTTGASSGGSSVSEVARTTIEAHKLEINRIRGYKLQLTVSEKQKLADLQAEVQVIDRRVADGLARPDELDDRKELLAEADRIIGKPIVDADADETLAELAGALEAILQPKLNTQLEKRVERLERISATFEQRVVDNPNNKTALQQFQTVQRVIADLKPLRDVKDLSQAETKAYNLAVEAVNNHVGIKIELTAKETIKVVELQASISQLQALIPDQSQQPTAAEVARAYVRLA